MPCWRLLQRRLTWAIPYIITLSVLNLLRITLLSGGHHGEKMSEGSYRSGRESVNPPAAHSPAPNNIGLPHAKPLPKESARNIPDKDCPDLPKPALGTESQTFQPFHDQGHVFSAHYDRRDKSIKVIALSNPILKPVSCRMWHHSTASPELTGASLITLPENHNQPIYGFQLSCRTTTKIPYAVSIVSSRCEQAKHVLYVRNISPNNTINGSITICTTPLFFNYDDASQLVELIEVNRLFGVDHLVFYNLSVGVNVNKYLRYYMRTGIADVIQWTLPRGNSSNSYGGVYYFAQVAAYLDCLLRSSWKSTYISFTDVDEILVPRSQSSLKELARKHNLTTQTCSLVFRNVFFRTEWPSNPKFVAGSLAHKYKMNSLLKTLREDRIWSGGSRSKYLSSVSQLLVPGIHAPSRCRSPYKMNTLRTSDGLLHHYRSWNAPKVNHGAVRDDFMLKYEPEIVDNIRNIHEKLDRMELEMT